MRCEDAQSTWLQARAAGTSCSDGLTAHLQQCPHCAAFASCQRHLDGLLALDGDQGPRPGFDTRFFARLQDDKQDEKRAAQPTNPMGGVLRWLLPAAAAVAAVGVLGVLVSRQPGDTMPGALAPPAGHMGAEPGIGSPPAGPQFAAAGEQAAEDLALARELDLVEELPVVERLDELEAYEVLAMLEVSELDALLGEEGSR